MKAYSSESRCPKCGSGDIGTGWHKDGNDYHHHFHDNDEMRGLDKVEHLCRHCRNCHFEWPEAIWGLRAAKDGE